MKLCKTPEATAVISGGPDHPCINGKAEFFQTSCGVIVRLKVSGLPTSSDICKQPMFAFHIHSGERCTGKNFSDSAGHFDPHNCQHPFHAGDMPSIMGVNGMAYTEFLTGRFKVNDIIGKTVIIHAMPDDMHTQPSGNSGEKIACGEVKRKL